MSIKRLAGWSLSLVGLSLISMAALRLATGALMQDRARREWVAADASASVATIRAEVDRPSLERPHREGAPVSRLIIPRIALDEIVVEGVSELSLNVGPGHFPGTVYPGERGNSVISAHRDRHFHRLDELRLGDTIQTEVDQNRQTWVIVSRKVIDKDSPAIFATATATLTLTTCWPVSYLGSAPDRLILVALPTPASTS